MSTAFMNRISYVLGLFVITQIFFIELLFAARVIQAKDKRILIQLESTESISIGQKIFLVSKDDKKVAAATVVQVKNNRAIAEISKGASAGNEYVELTDYGMTPEKEALNHYSKTLTTSHRLSSLRIAVTGIISMNNMATKQSDAVSPTPNTETVNMTGLSFGLGATADYNYNPWLVLRGTLGYEPFNASGSSQFVVCNNLSSRDCSATLGYLSAGGFARYDYIKAKTTYWVGAGLVIKHPLSKTTTALRSDDIRTTSTIALTTGADIHRTDKTYIPVALEYQMFQSSETVSANLILIRAGYGWIF
jgi:hypothetical protein